MSRRYWECRRCMGSTGRYRGSMEMFGSGSICYDGAGTAPRAG